MRLLVLAGGFGTRLTTVVSDVPKALAPIGDIPFLRLQLEHWHAQGLREFTFLLHHQATQIISFLRAEQASLLKDCKVEWLIEPVPMDTGGAVARAVKILGYDDNFLVTNADTWLGGGIEEMLTSAAPSLAVVHLSDVGRYGQVHFDHAQRVTAFVEKKDASTSGWINAGLCHLNASLFENWDGQPLSLERDIFASFSSDSLLRAVPLQTDFIDIGIPADYHSFCRWAATGREGSPCS